MTRNTAIEVLGCVMAVTLCPVTLHAKTAGKSRMDQELDLIWGKERAISVLEKRRYQKDGRHEFTLFTGVAPNDPFFNYVPVGLRYDYFLMESLAVEFAGAYVFHPESDLRAFVMQHFPAVSKARLPQRVTWYAGLYAYWTPLHGKFAVFTSKIANFDLGVILGVCAIGSYVSSQGGDVWSYKKAPDPAGVAGIGARFFLSDLFALKTEYRHYVFHAYDGGARFMAEFTVGVSILTAPPR